MAERSSHGKSVLEFGKANMYVIAEDGLQKESIICHSKPAIYSEAFSGKKVISSGTRAIEFSWKEFANGTKHGDKFRVLDLNGSVRVDVNMKRNVNSETRAQCYAGAKSHKKHLNQPPVCLNAPGVNDFKETANEHEKVSDLASMICSFALNGLKKGTSITTDKTIAEEKSRRENDEDQRNVFDSKKCFFDKKRLCYGRCANSLPNEKARGNSTNLICEEQDDFENSNRIPRIVTEKNVESPGKFYLKRIFYSKGNNYSKPRKQGYLPQIPRKTENQLGMDSSRTAASLNTETNPRKSDKIILPLNVSVLKKNEKQKHHFKSIVKLPTMVDKKTGQVHLALAAIAYERSDYNKWSRRQKRITPRNAKTASTLSFPLISKNIR